MQILKALLISIIVCIIMDVPLNGAYSTFSQHNSYFVMIHEYSYLFKYFLLVVIFTFLIIRHGELMGFGKIFVPLLFVAGIAGCVVVLCWYDAVSPDKIVQQRIWGKTEKSWDDIRVVITGGRIVHTNESGENEESVKLEYTMQFKDKTSINFWDKIDSVEKLNNYVKEKQINISHNFVDDKLAKELEEHIDGDVFVAKQILQIQQ
ncbi:MULTISPECIES: hypothetical protein [Bacillus cereus group]|uniref:Uncharacterized protein n=2 Tax=Bacillus cereus group TaxID=86661 RepID=A0A9X6SSR9_BACCE|nr:MULTISPECIES: hypothetical protein [Bacillus cereus group]MDA1675311.1 hypothetical protein [Bacillus cereus group sp. TH152-1LC]PDZ94529.1 hypothetical protein CON36_33330 [Bacillus cereus]PFJ42728.1 hypothetical protein COJ15_05140 [Bacillus thuringiensis]PGP21041.1 hypothetical protein COA01_16000 [Bacillus cereus]